MRKWTEHISQLTTVLDNLAFTRRDGTPVPVDVGFLEWTEESFRLRERHGTVFLIGNGASASMASHFSADLAKNGRMRTQVFSDLSLITAISNDMGYEHVFAEPLRRCAQSGDLLIAISSSGCSRNILEAVDAAEQLGLTVITLSGKDPANPLRRRGNLNAYIPAETYGLAETGHAAALHWWLDLFLLRDGPLN